MNLKVISFLFIIITMLSCGKQNNNKNLLRYNNTLLKNEIKLFQKSINECCKISPNRYKVEAVFSKQINYIYESTSQELISFQNSNDSLDSIVKRYILVKYDSKRYLPFLKRNNFFVKYNCSDNFEINELNILIKTRASLLVISDNTCTSEIDGDKKLYTMD